MPPTRLLAVAVARHTPLPTRAFSTTSRLLQTSNPHAIDKKDAHNVQQDAVREGQAERAAQNPGDSSATTQSARDGSGEDVHKKTKREFPEAKGKGPVIGMNNERGGVSVPGLMAERRKSLRDEADLRRKDNDMGERVSRVWVGGWKRGGAEIGWEDGVLKACCVAFRFINKSWPRTPLLCGIFPSGTPYPMP